MSDYWVKNGTISMPDNIMADEEEFECQSGSETVPIEDLEASPNLANFVGNHEDLSEDVLQANYNRPQRGYIFDTVPSSAPFMDQTFSAVPMKVNDPCLSEATNISYNMSSAQQAPSPCPVSVLPHQRIQFHPSHQSSDLQDLNSSETLCRVSAPSAQSTMVVDRHQQEFLQGNVYSFQNLGPMVGQPPNLHQSVTLNEGLENPKNQGSQVSPAPAPEQSKPSPVTRGLISGPPSMRSVRGSTGVEPPCKRGRTVENSGLRGLLQQSQPSSDAASYIGWSGAVKVHRSGAVVKGDVVTRGRGGFGSGRGRGRPKVAKIRDVPTNSGPVARKYTKIESRSSLDGEKIKKEIGNNSETMKKFDQMPKSEKKKTDVGTKNDEKRRPKSTRSVARSSGKNGTTQERESTSSNGSHTTEFFTSFEDDSNAAPVLKKKFVESDLTGIRSGGSRFWDMETNEKGQILLMSKGLKDRKGSLVTIKVPYKVVDEAFHKRKDTNMKEHLESVLENRTNSISSTNVHTRRGPVATYSVESVAQMGGINNLPRNKKRHALQSIAEKKIEELLMDTFPEASPEVQKALHEALGPLWKIAYTAKYDEVMRKTGYLKDGHCDTA